MKHLVTHGIHLKADACIVFNCLCDPIPSISSAGSVGVILALTTMISIQTRPLMITEAAFPLKAFPKIFIAWVLKHPSNVGTLMEQSYAF